MSLFGVPMEDMTVDEFLERIEQLIDRPEPALVSPINADQLNHCYERRWLRDFIAGADLIHVDGAGVQLGLRLKGQHLRHKLSTNEIIYDLARRWEHSDYSIYFLGGPEGQAERAAQYLWRRFPKLNIIGWHHGYFPERDAASLIEQINALNPSVLFVGFGCPLQEWWIRQHRERIRVPLVWPVGNLTSYLGNVPTAPLWMKRNGLEWVHRLALEPKRLWRRYLVGNPKFVWRVIKHERLHLPNPYWAKGEGKPAPRQVN